MGQAVVFIPRTSPKFLLDTPLTGAISAGSSAGSQFWGTNQISSRLWKLENLADSTSSFHGTFSACLLPASREDQVNVFQCTLKAIPILHAHRMSSEMRRQVAVGCVAQEPSGMGKCHLVWVSWSRKRDKANTLVSLAGSEGLGIPWPHRKAGIEVPVLGAETLGDHEQGKTTSCKMATPAHSLRECMSESLQRDFMKTKTKWHESSDTDAND